MQKEKQTPRYIFCMPKVEVVINGPYEYASYLDCEAKKRQRRTFDVQITHCFMHAPSDRVQVATHDRQAPGPSGGTC